MDIRPARRVLNAGSGPSTHSSLHSAFNKPGWKELRIDVDPQCGADFVGSISDMRSLIEDASFDAIWCSHCLEHLYDHEALPAMREFKRILRDDGFALISSPNMDAIAKLLVSEDIESVAYVAPAGPIRLLDMIFGHTRSIEAGRPHMAHKTGFTADRLGRMATKAGFAEARVLEGDNLDLWAALMMPKADVSALAAFFEDTNIAALFGEPPAPGTARQATSRKRVRILAV
ncbi:MAG: methyltransferase domain-containing protein [Hyphomicrobiales bacterium]|nr:methyltransferase domain-containing protein [Hyphomicrobiales bacterium]